MKSPRRYHSLSNIVLMAGILLAAQTLIFWHTHHGSVGQDQHCQICLHAQHHTPAAATVVALVPALFTQVQIINPVNSETIHFVYRYYTRTRAPPVVFLS